MANNKTNVMRILDKAHISHKEYTYDHSDGKIDGVAVAQKMGQPLEQVFKTLVTKGTGRDYYVFVIPVAKELDLKAAARAVGQKAVEMIPVSDLLKVTGYIRGGCSPIGMKRAYPTVLDSACEALPTLIVSGGKIGYQIELSPRDLMALTGAKTAPITAPGTD
ncbi:Cys-tRNA(Pro) deacylase [Zongyangia hominis]|uniref:Cys-tRNA(Pro)/Cys-tRNA(Cys) deacylase n=1 Tax=Zongyangia hominis TaxID=2763677 RepID=A0A926ECX3_9FIRM|nr:Cys-tRNA(Pro) deacylase [Zongyangia hominis]MBC8570758.1 Cys-tRNA(Pro) deacylase [Zongyangia hominis]